METLLPIATNWNYPPDPELEPVTEIVSVHGSSEAADSPGLIYKPVFGNFVRETLADRGYVLGFVGSGDPDHHLNWLKKALRPVVKGRRFDVVLIDCPPSLGKLTLSVLIAATGLLIPLQCEYYPLEGISSITDLMEQLKSSGVNRKLELLGVLMTMFDSRTNLSRMVVTEVREHFGDKVFRTVIPRATRVAESPSHGKPILYYDPYSAGSAAYEGTSKELAKRLGLE